MRARYVVSRAADSTFKCMVLLSNFDVYGQSANHAEPWFRIRGTKTYCSVRNISLLSRNFGSEQPILLRRNYSFWPSFPAVRRGSFHIAAFALITHVRHRYVSRNKEKLSFCIQDHKTGSRFCFQILNMRQKLIL